MRKTAIEVKTIYDIEITEDELFEIFDNYRKNETKKALYPNAFENLADEEKFAKWFSSVKTWQLNGHLAGLIADHFGFDGWERAPRKLEDKKLLRLQVFNHGADI